MPERSVNCMFEKEQQDSTAENTANFIPATMPGNLIYLSVTRNLPKIMRFRSPFNSILVTMAIQPQDLELSSSDRLSQVSSSCDRQLTPVANKATITSGR
ncbi:hypothetical protein F0562_028789 [Nyssa sinensis]|uniref:Uncharacterized protein n=1 Tax=Nyssa sinensis TaxID=561372 RepID=A0A5J5B590_9ASTE|nr:hypothetical protein F0562_028789 [Nyssa sinensis]